MLFAPKDGSKRGGTLHLKSRVFLLCCFGLCVFSTLGAALSLFATGLFNNGGQVKAANPNGVPFGVVYNFEFVDMVKQSARFQGLNGATLQYDTDGWPQSDFSYIFLDDRRNMPWSGPDFDGVPRDVSGTYHLSFTGQATLATQGSEDPDAITFQNVQYDGNTNKTTADVVVKPNHWLLTIVFNQTKRDANAAVGSGISDVRLIRPGYAANTTQVFTNRFLDTLQQLGPRSLRTFDTGNVGTAPNYVTATWSDRSLPSDSYWPLPAKNTGNRRGLGVPWEYVIQLCNTLNADPWIIVPISADDAYITALAQLFKNGNQFTAPLNANLHINIEYSNEVWNSQFSQWGYNNTLAQSEGIDSITRYVERTVQISNLFQQVYGSGSINTTLRPVAVWQYNNQLNMQNALLWAQQKFGQPIKNYLYGIGQAGYVDPADRTKAPGIDPADPKSFDQIIDTLSSAGQNRVAFTHWRAIATFFGLHQVSYESGPSLNTGPEAEALRSQRMTDFIRRYFMENYFVTGADTAEYYALGPNNPTIWGSFFLFEDYTQALNDPRFKGAQSVMGQDRPQIGVGHVLPWSVNSNVTIDASQPVPEAWQPQRTPGSTITSCPGGCWPQPGHLNYLLRVPTSGTYNLVLNGHTNQAGGKVDIQIDNNSLGTPALSLNNDADTSAVSVSLTPGLHGLSLTPIGGNLSLTGNAITFTLTSGGGSAIAPSSPMNLTATVDSGRANLQWETVTTATNYTIKRGTTSGGPYTTVGTTTNTSYSDTGLTNDTTYYYVVVATNSAGNSILSPQRPVIPTTANAPARPTNVSGTAGGADPTFIAAGGEVRITWPKVANATAYNIKRSTSSGGPFDTIVSQASNFYYDSSLNNGTTYYYVVSATNSFGESPNSDVVTLTPQITRPATPTNLQVTAGNGKVQLKWTQSPWQYPSFGSLFNVKRANSASGPFTTVFSLSTNNITDVDLTNGTTYCYVISALNSAGESADTAPQCATPSGSSNPTPTPTATPIVTPTPTPTGSTANVAQTSAALTIDGNGSDSVWSSATSYPITHKVGSPRGFSASYQAAWDNTNLYLLVKVTDNTLAAHPDMVEVYLDPDHSGGSSYDSQDMQYQFPSNSTTVSQFNNGWPGTNTAGVTFANKSVTNGYQVEILIPWARLAISPSNITQIGFDLDVQQDTGNSSKNKLFWNATSDDDWHNPSLFGTGILLRAGSAQIAPTNTALTVDGNNSESVWSSAKSYTLSQKVGSPSGFSASYQAAWDSSNLYLLVKVKDSTLSSHPDMVEVYLDPNHSGGSSYDSQDMQYQFPSNSTTVSQFNNGWPGTNTAGVSFAKKSITGGYQVEIKIPWARLGVTPSTNMVLGLDLDAWQNAGNSSDKLFWNATSDDDWHNPSLFGTALLK